MGVYKDDIVNGFKDKDYVKKVAQFHPHLGELFSDTIEAIKMEQNWISN